MRATWWILGGIAAVAAFGGAAVSTPIIWAVPPLYRLKAQRFMAELEAAERANGLPPGMLVRVAYQESRFDPDAVSPAGAVGLMQFMPATALEFAIDPRDPVASIHAAGRYLSKLYQRFGNWSEALAAYNWGQGNQMRKDRPDGIIGDDWPEETRRYVASITSDLGIS